MKKVLTFIFFIHLFIGNSITLYSQNYVDLFNIGSTYAPYNQHGSTGKKVEIRESFLNLKLPIVLKSKGVIIIGSNLNFFSFNKEISLSGNNEFYAGSLPLGYTKQWSEKWNTLLMVIPKLSSDLKDITLQDYQLGGILLCTYVKRENLKYKFGAYYNQEYFGPFFVPVLGIDWQPTERLSVFGNLPISFTVDYKLGKKISAGIYFIAPSTSFRLGENYNNAYLQKNSQDLSLYLDSHIAENIVFTIKAGHSLGRNNQFYSEKDRLIVKISAFNIGTTKPPLNDAIKDSFVFELRMSYRIPIKNKKMKEEE